MSPASTNWRCTQVHRPAVTKVADAAPNELPSSLLVLDDWLREHGHTIGAERLRQLLGTSNDRG